MTPSDTALVYSTAAGEHCAECGAPRPRCTCRKPAPRPAGDGIVRVGRETKGRKGKGVTIVTGLRLADEALNELGRELRQKCGAGGTVRDGIIEIQGEHRDRLVADLIKKGYTVKKSGG